MKFVALRALVVTAAVLATGLVTASSAHAAGGSAGVVTVQRQGPYEPDHYVLSGAFSNAGRSVVTTASGDGYDGYFSASQITLQGSGLVAACGLTRDRAAAVSSEALQCLVSIKGGPYLTMAFDLIFPLEGGPGGAGLTEKGVFYGLGAAATPTIPGRSSGSADFDRYSYASSSVSITLTGQLVMGGRTFRGSARAVKWWGDETEPKSLVLTGTSPGGDIAGTCVTSADTSASGGYPPIRMTCTGSIGGGPTGKSSVMLAWGPLMSTQQTHGDDVVASGAFAG